MNDPSTRPSIAPRVRIASALAALLALGWLLIAGVGAAPPAPVSPARGLAWLAAPLVVAIAGLARGAWWGRWLPLAGGLAVLPWALAFLTGPRYGASAAPPLVAGLAAATLLVALTGRAMFERFEGRVAGWRDPRLGVARLAIVANLASMLVLFAFVAAYEARVPGRVALLGAVLLLLTSGVLLLARRRTVGLLLLAAGCLAFLPVGAWFVAGEAATGGEAVLFVAATLPGVLAGIATLLAFRRGLARLLRHGPR